MDSHSISLTLPGEAGEWRVDVPMRSFQGGKSSNSSEEVGPANSCVLLRACQVTTPNSSRSIPTSVSSSGNRTFHILFLSSTRYLPTARRNLKRTLYIKLLLRFALQSSTM